VTIVFMPKSFVTAVQSAAAALVPSAAACA
jgi:hypothetical protein